MGKTKVAVLGGGVGALTAAYYLTATPALRNRYEVTVYTLGWRLGGKGATGRDQFGRIQEHGLHMWFGYYNNAFKMLKDVFKEWQPHPDNSLQNWRDAFVPHRFTPIGQNLTDGTPVYWPITWSALAGEVGDDNVLPTPWEAAVNVFEILFNLIRNWQRFNSLVIRGKLTPADITTVAPPRLRPDHATLDRGLASRYLDAVKSAVEMPLVVAERAAALASGVALSGAEELAEIVHRWAAALSGDHLDQATRHQHIADLLSLLPGLSAAVAHLPQAHVLRDFFTFAIPYLRGIATDFIWLGKTAMEVDALEFTQWLIKHGGDGQALKTCNSLRTVYDTFMEYQDGDYQRPNYGAGTAAQLSLRMMATCKEEVAWLMQAGMGDVVVAPIYEVLRQRGVAIRYFRRTDRLELSPDKKTVDRVHLARQVDLVSDDYDAMIKVPVEGTTRHMLAWPDQPRWDQIKNGAAIKQACDATQSSLESHWCPVPPVGAEKLERGRDFDLVVLGISIGAFMKLNDQDHSLAEELIAASPRFRAMVEHFSLIPTQSVQTWCKTDLDGLGWNAGRPAANAGPEPMSVWADMSQTLRFEPWTGQATRPGSVHYLCGVWATDLIKRPATQTDVPKKALDDVTGQIDRWFNDTVQYYWPNAVAPGGGMNYDVLYDALNGTGRQRFVNQWIRANVDPTECLPGSGAGTTQYRLKADETGFDNLYIAGCWTNSGMNTSSVESTVASGMQAARAICGTPVEVSGEYFLQARPK